MSVEEFRIFDNYCVGECINVETIYNSRIEYANDLIELLSLLPALKPSNTAKLHLYLNFLSCYFSFVNVTELLGYANHLKDRLVGLSIQAKSSPVGIKGKINLENLNNAEILRLSSFNINGSFLSCQTLKELSFAPEYAEGGNILDLPLTLKRFDYTDSENYSCEVPFLGKAQIPLLSHVCLSGLLIIFQKNQYRMLFIL